MATDKLINSTQGDDIIDALNDIADNVGNITYGPQTSSDKVVSMLGYAEAAEAASINPGDTLNVAIGKLEKKANDNATNVANKIDKLTNATAGDIATVTATGEIADSTVSIADSNTGLADSDTAVPTSKTVKTYVDSTATGISRYLGTITAASGLSTSAKKGDFYVVKTAWTGVHAGDEIIAEKDGPAQTIDGTNWSLLHNEADTDTKYQFGEGTTNGTFLVTPSDTGVAQPVPIKGLGSAAYTTADTSSLTNDNNHVPTSALAKSLLDAKVPTTRKVNNKALSSDITLSASDVSAVPSSNVTTTLPASSAAASTSKVMSEKLVYDNYVQNSDFVVAENNIKYAINNGVKNQLKLTGDVYNPNTLFAYWDYTNGTIRVVGSSATSATVFIYLGSWTAPEDNVYRLYANGLACTANIRIYDDASWTTYAATSSESNEATWTKGTTRHLYLRIASNVVVGDITITPMICPKSVFDADSSFVPYGAPNSDLSAIEAEDRAALAEELDAGAKNLFNPVNVSSTAYGTWSASTGTFTQTGTDTKANLNLTFKARTSSTASWNDIFINRIIATNGVVSIPFTCPVNATEFRIGHNGSSQDAVMVMTGFSVTTGTQCVVQLNVTNAVQASGKYSWKDIMICTKAAFGVSSKFVPYRPNYDLVYDSIVWNEINLSSSADLDTLFDKNTSWVSLSSAVSSTIVHTPWTSGGFCVHNEAITSRAAIKSGAGGLFYQYLTPNNGDTILMFRRKYDGSRGWDPWYKFDGGTQVN